MNQPGTVEQRCVEIFATSEGSEGRLLGYAIFFAGYWDAWRMTNPSVYRRLEWVRSCPSREEAIQAVLE
jgi:hypothetical protein